MNSAKADNRTETAIEYIKISTASLWELTTKNGINSDLIWALDKIISMNQHALELLTEHTDFITAFTPEPGDSEEIPAATQFGPGYYCYLDENGEILERWTGPDDGQRGG